MDDLNQEYQRRFRNALKPIACGIEDLLQEYLKGLPRIDRVSARAKEPLRFITKAGKVENGMPKYSDPLSQIQDQIGARVVVFYERDVVAVSARVEKYFHLFEKRLQIPETEWEFGYFGLHYVLLLPREAVPTGVSEELAPEQFELQIKTLWQHAWSEANHDLAYKPSAELPAGSRRLMAYASAQAWGADRTFSELFENTERGALVPTQST